VLIFNLDTLQKQAGLQSPNASLAMASAVLAPLCAQLPDEGQMEFLALLPPPLGRSILLQLPTTSPYASLEHYVIQVANQEGVRRERAIVHIALVISLLAPHLPASIRESLGSELYSLLPPH
jgi:uncharacterized protein (DUF2267 family)